MEFGFTQLVMPAGTAHQTHTELPLSIQPCQERAAPAPEILNSPE